MDEVKDEATADKPLHVQVAEALGWTEMRPRKEDGLWGGRAPDTAWEWTSPPRYDTNWSATGPLIEKYGINLCRTKINSTWTALGQPVTVGHDGELYGEVEAVGETPLLAACNLILVLAEAGKLKA